MFLLLALARESSMSSSGDITDIFRTAGINFADGISSLNIRLEISSYGDTLRKSKLRRVSVSGYVTIIKSNWLNRSFTLYKATAKKPSRSKVAGNTLRSYTTIGNLIELTAIKDLSIKSIQKLASRKSSTGND
jgi:hypothetical protein